MRPRSQRRRASAAARAGLLAVAACNDLPDVEVVGERIAIAPYHDAPICTGTVVRLDGLVETLEDEIGLESPERITWYWGQDGVDDACAGGVACAAVHDRNVFGRMTALRHELAHVIGGEVGVAGYFVDEGFAGLHTDWCALLDGTPEPPEEYFDMPYADFVESGAHAVATHFALYMAQAHGPDAVLEWKDRAPKGSSRAETTAAFEAAFGEPLDGVAQRWRNDAPPFLCVPYLTPPDFILVDQPLHFETTLDCKSDRTEGPYDDVFSAPPDYEDEVGVIPLMFETWEVDVPFEMFVEASFEGPPGSFAWIDGRACSSYNGDGEYQLQPGEDRVLGLGSCRCYVSLMADPDEVASVELDLVPKAGP